MEKERKAYNKDDKLIFEGEYLNGKRWNGKLYDLKDKNIYELKEGKGLAKKYDKNGKLCLEAEFLNREKNGKLKEYYNGELKFEGEYLKGKRNGNGKEYNK